MDDVSDDIDFESEADAGDVVAAQAKIKKMRDELTRVKKERQDYLDGWQRCKADAVNAKKDMEVRAARSAELLREALVHDIIPALDSFDMAAGSELWSAVDEGWRRGMEHVRDQLIDALKSHRVERYGKVGDVFDHALHEAAGESSDAMGEPGTIVRVLRCGYKIGERVLRAAQVVVKAAV